jgi:thioesterase domain-containing protein
MRPGTARCRRVSGRRSAPERYATMNAAELERYLHERIPLSRAMDVTVEHVGADEVRLCAPLAPNVNHEGTAFGGSIAALAVLAGWGWLRARLDGAEPLPRLVVQRQEVDYLAAAIDGLVATCAAPSSEEWERFAKLLGRRGRARLELAVDVVAGGARVATMRGVYVATAGEGA